MLSSSTESTDPVAEVRLLRRQVQRERARRQAAETLGERATRDLYESVRQLRSAQSELLERADRTGSSTSSPGRCARTSTPARLVQPGGRVRRTHDLGRPLRRAARRPRAASRRCAAPGARRRTMAALPRPGSFVELPETLTTLLLEAAQHLEPVEIDDVDQDERLRRPPVRPRSSSRSVCTRWPPCPVAVGDQVMGWILLQSLQPADLAGLASSRSATGSGARPRRHR